MTLKIRSELLSGLVRDYWKTAGGTVLALCMLAGLICLSAGSTDPNAPLRENARKAECLARKNRAEFQEIADDLGVQLPGTVGVTGGPSTFASKPDTLLVWRAGHPQQFRTVCLALVSMDARPLLDPAPGPRWWRRILGNPAVNLALGGALTFFFGWLTTKRDQRNQMRAELTKAGGEHLKAVDGYLASMSNVPPAPWDPTEAKQRRTDLWFAIQRQPLPPSTKDALAAKLDALHRLIHDNKGGDWPQRQAAIEHELNGLQTALSRAVRGWPDSRKVGEAL